MDPSFESSVFVNCPFDEDYEPILQAICFCVVILGFTPRLAPENSDVSSPRLDRIIDLVRGSKYGIHDLSRSRAGAAGEYLRMNMPFELGLDLGARRFGSGQLESKVVLVLESERYDSQKALSDIAGWDVEAHGNDYLTAIRRVHRWLTSQAPIKRIGPSMIEGKYIAFGSWYWNRELATGASEGDIREYPTVDVVRAMHDWMGEGQPAT